MKIELQLTNTSTVITNAGPRMRRVFLPPFEARNWLSLLPSQHAPQTLVNFTITTALVLCALFYMLLLTMNLLICVPFAALLPSL